MPPADAAPAKLGLGCIGYRVIRIGTKPSRKPDSSTMLCLVEDCPHPPNPLSQLWEAGWRAGVRAYHQRLWHRQDNRGQGAALPPTRHTNKYATHRLRPLSQQPTPRHKNKNSDLSHPYRQGYQHQILRQQRSFISQPLFEKSKEGTQQTDW